MSNQQDSVRERLLDASLSELFGRGEAASVEADAWTQGPQRSSGPARNNALLAAALVLLGSFVVVGSWLWSRPSDRVPAGAIGAQGQDPRLPKLWPHNPNHECPELPLTVCEDLADLDDLPFDIVNLRVELSSLKDLERVARFSKLRRLHLLGRGPRSFWTVANGDAGALNPLQKLQDLQILRLPQNFSLVPAHVRALRALPDLQSFAIMGSHPLTAEIADELVALPSLRQLHLSLALVPPSFFAHLQGGKLEDLVLGACANLGNAEFAEIAKIHSLRSLAVKMAGKGSCSIDGKRYQIFELEDSAFAAFLALPNLVALDLDESEFHDDFMRKLPPQLRYLRLGDRVMTPATLGLLQRLKDVEELRFNHATKYEDVIDLLQALPLKRVWLRGWLDDDVVATLSKHATLESVTLRLRTALDLSSLAVAPKLRSLTLRYDKRFDVTNLPPSAVMKAFEDRGIQVTLKKL